MSLLIPVILGSVRSDRQGIKAARFIVRELEARGHRPVLVDPDPETLLVTPTGDYVGGHQWTLIGHSHYYNAGIGLCWWGPDFGNLGRFRIAWRHVGELLADGGDAHITYRAGRTG